ncbi:hypothetical protein BsWGS_05279 [Bradybaena similaris]
MTLNLTESQRNDLFEVDFNPERALKAMEAMCAVYFAKHPVQTEPGAIYCNSTFDSFSCWPTTRNGKIARITCPDVSITDPTASATKECYENGTWAPAVYNACVLANPRKEHPYDHMYTMKTISIRIIYDVGFSVSTVVLILALAIFLNFR